MLSPSRATTTWWTLAVLVAVAGCIGARLYLPTAARNFVNRALDDNGAYTGSVRDVDLGLWRGAFVLYDLEIVKRNGKVPVPFVSLPQTTGSLSWSALFRSGAVVLQVQVQGPALRVVAAPTAAERQDGSGAHGREAKGPLKKALFAAVEAVEDEEDEHVYHTTGWSRELWIEALGMPAVLPPPEEEREVKTAIGAARAKAAREEML